MVEISYFLQTCGSFCLLGTQSQILSVQGGRTTGQGRGTYEGNYLNEAPRKICIRFVDLCSNLMHFLTFGLFCIFAILGFFIFFGVSGFFGFSLTKCSL